MSTCERRPAYGGIAPKPAGGLAKPWARVCLLLAEWSRPVFAGERPVYFRLPTFGFGPRRRQTAVTLNRSQRSSSCRALSFSARSLRSPLRSNMA